VEKATQGLFPLGRHPKKLKIVWAIYLRIERWQTSSHVDSARIQSRWAASVAARKSCLTPPESCARLRGDPATDPLDSFKGD
jgi:hypothetical protein